MINADKPHNWKSDVEASVQLYNEWFLEAAPEAYRDTRAKAIADVKVAFDWTTNMTVVTPDLLLAHPGVLQVLRMCTSPPLARDRLTGLADVSKGFVKTLEEGKLPSGIRTSIGMAGCERMCAVIQKLLDGYLFPWCQETRTLDEREQEIAATVVADRLVGSIADPIIRNAQERRQLGLIETWLKERGYTRKSHSATSPLKSMEPGTYSFRQVVVVGDDLAVNIPVDVVIQPHHPLSHGYPILIEAKSAGDFTNTNKRRKEEATKVRQLRAKFGPDISLLLFLCGYFDAGYLGYEAAEGLDWVWEHRVADLSLAGVDAA